MSNELRIALPDDLQQEIAKLIESGEFDSANAVVVQALRILVEQKSGRSASIAQFRTEIARGLEESERGDLMDGEEFFRSLEERLGGSF